MEKQEPARKDIQAMKDVIDVAEAADEFMDEYADVFVALAQEGWVGEKSEDRDDSPELE